MAISGVSGVSSVPYIQQPQAASQTGTQAQTTAATPTSTDQQAAATQQPGQVRHHHHHRPAGDSTAQPASTSDAQGALDILA